MKRHNFVRVGGMKENPGVWSNGQGGIVYVEECACGVTRKKGVDTTGVRPGNDWGPYYYDLHQNRIPSAGKCQREVEE
jgi:hypothetical protein